MLNYIYIALFSMFVISCHSTKKIEEVKVIKKKQNTLINFVDSDGLVKVLDMAKEEGKPIFLYLHTSWCTPCRFMEKEVFSFKPSADHMNTSFINYEVDLEKGNGPDLSVIYGTSTIPTLIILDFKGNELTRHEGSIGNEKLISWSNDILDKYSL